MAAALVLVALSACAREGGPEVARLQEALKAKERRIESLSRELGAKCAVAPDAGAEPEKLVVIRAAEDLAGAVCACADPACAAEAADRHGARLDDEVTRAPPKTPEQAKALREAVTRARQCMTRFAPRDAG